jgi:tetrahydromethanopterin S-methyltransferase subunit D
MDIERKLARIEGKVSVIGNAVGLILGMAVGLTVYYFTRDFEWAKGYGVASAIAVVFFYVAWPIRRINQLTDRDDD